MNDQKNSSKWKWDVPSDKTCISCLCFDMDLHWYCHYHGETVTHWSGGCEAYYSKQDHKKRMKMIQIY